MGKFLLGVATGVALACMCSRKMNHENIAHMCDSTSKFFDKAKQKIKDGIDTGKNEAEYLKDRATDAMNS